jgi:hypothetical protein
MKRLDLKHEFVEYIPRELEEGVLYISIRYRTAVHQCACGCRNKVVTPIRPSDWKLLFDGDTVSLTPSIGNWQFPCRSHYWIKNNQIRWAGQWTDDQIVAGRGRDRRDRERYLARRAGRDPSQGSTGDFASRQPAPARRGPWKRLREWLASS